MSHSTTRLSSVPRHALEAPVAVRDLPGPRRRFQPGEFRPVFNDVASCGETIGRLDAEEARILAEQVEAQGAYDRALGASVDPRDLDERERAITEIASDLRRLRDVRSRLTAELPVLAQREARQQERARAEAVQFRAKVAELQARMAAYAEAVETVAAFLRDAKALGDEYDRIHLVRRQVLAPLDGPEYSLGAPPTQHHGVLLRGVDGRPIFDARKIVYGVDLPAGLIAVDDR